MVAAVARRVERDACLRRRGSAAAARECRDRPVDHRAPSRALSLGGRRSGQRDPGPARRAETAGEGFDRSQPAELPARAAHEPSGSTGASSSPGPRSGASATRCGQRGERFLTVANLHDSSVPDWRVPDAELLRAAVFAESVAEPDDVLVLAGDFNVIREHSKTLELLSWAGVGVLAPDLRDRPDARARSACGTREALAGRAAPVRRASTVRPRTGGGDDRVTHRRSPRAVSRSSSATRT